MQSQNTSTPFPHYVLEEAGHGDPQFETEENLDRVFRFFDRHLR